LTHEGIIIDAVTGGLVVGSWQALYEEIENACTEEEHQEN
jgi:hypothetical protein